MVGGYKMKLLKLEVVGKMMSPLHDKAGKMFTLDLWVFIMSSVWDEVEHGISLPYSCWDMNHSLSRSWIGNV